MLLGRKHLSLASDGQGVQVCRALRELPTKKLEERPLEKQPVVVRLHREGAQSFLIALNQSPWPVDCQLDYEAAQSLSWRRLGATNASDQPDTNQAGTIAAGPGTWPVSLEPYGIHIWSLAGGQFQLTELRVLDDPELVASLAQRIGDIQARAGNLSTSRPYPQLQNPGFELQEGVARIFGWQIRRYGAGSAAIDSGNQHEGKRSLRLQSDNAAGLAVQSHLFPNPSTGMLMLSAHVACPAAQPDAQLVLVVESEDEGQTYQRYLSLPASRLNEHWTRQELLLDDLPGEASQQLRVKFHALGEMEVLIDDVSLVDLHFSEQQRREILKRVFAAKTALDARQIVDCHRLLEGDWSRYLLQHVRAAGEAEVQVASLPGAQLENPSEEKGRMGARLKSLVPHIWR